MKFTGSVILLSATLALFSCQKEFACECIINDNNNEVRTETFETFKANEAEALSKCLDKEDQINQEAGTSAECSAKKQ